MIKFLNNRAPNIEEILRAKNNLLRTELKVYVLEEDSLI